MINSIACGLVNAFEDTFCTECGGEIEYDDEVYLCKNYKEDTESIVCHNCYHNKIYRGGFRL